MITFTITIETDNAAFGDSAPEKHEEVARLLNDTDWTYAASADRTLLRDCNGNTVGAIVRVETGVDDDDEDDEPEEPCDECGGTLGDETAHESWCSRHPDHDGG